MRCGTRGARRGEVEQLTLSAAAGFLTPIPGEKDFLFQRP